MSNDIATPVSPEKNPPTAHVCVSKEDAAKMKVGSSVSLSLSGEVKSLHPSYYDKSQYEVEIENPVVEIESQEDENAEKYNMAKMPRKDLKKQIMPKDEEV